MSLQFKVNGKTVSSNSEADTPLLWVIRDELGLTGTKFGCGAALCGACTVHVNGEAVRSWVKHQVPQCGYCQSGQLMSAAALLSKNKNPSDADIDAAMAGNVCRCGTYTRIRAAVKDAASMMRAA